MSYQRQSVKTDFIVPSLAGNGKFVRARENSNLWAEVFAMVEKINHFKTPQDFYGGIDPTVGVQEVFDHLKGWHKKSVKTFVLSGPLAAQQFGSGKKHVVQWSYGCLAPKAARAKVVVRKYDDKATDWTDYREVTEHLTWGQICSICAI